MNNAAYDYIARCASSDLDLKAPPQDLRIWIFKNMTSSSAAMLHHGAFVEGNDLIQRYLGGYSSLLKTFLPDITIGAKAGEGKFVDLYSAVMHEMAHASHYAQVGNAWWNPYITYDGGDLPAFGTAFWFYPQIFRYLYERGMTCADLFKALKTEVTSRDDLLDALVTLFPEQERTIYQVFNRYSR